MKIYVVDEMNNTIEEFVRCLDEDMPYTTCGRLTVRDFKAESNTSIMWTTKRFLASVEEIVDPCLAFDVRTGFLRAFETPDNGFYQHLLGTALEGGETLSYFYRMNLAKRIEEEALMDWIGDIDHEPSLMQFFQAPESASVLVPFETIRLNDQGISVFVLQDALWTLGYCIDELNGVFDQSVENAVWQFQNENGLILDGIVGPETWRTLMHKIHFDEERFNAVIDEF